MDDNNGRQIGNSATCGADSFMLRDSVCDDTTNTKACLYDGGDCCLEMKNTHLCRQCQCILDVDPHKLEDYIIHLDIREIALTEAKEQQVLLTVDNVVSGQVCATLCLEHDNRDYFNSWSYFQKTSDKEQGGCMCSWTSSVSLCSGPARNLPTVDFNDFNADHNVTLTKMFVQVEKTLPCGEIHCLHV